QTGLAVDIFDQKYSVYDYSKMNAEFYKWLDANCAEYGFIKRYPSDKVELTGWDQPWHYRYVGKEAAKFIMENDLCFEEFCAHYR
ncbi:MAG: D-alanyl-D-alanine carboxypeptidase family protein, partial [Clostridiales bacterium]|nr:D-alanyl-D-alanine carboxypeptidase family protein [Clostridiales bacterium]